MIGGLLRVLVIALVLLVAALMLMPRPAAPPAATEVATVLDAPRPLPEVALVDTRGEPFALAALAGRPTLVFFGFTHCPDVCPLTLDVIARAVARLREEAPGLVPQVLFVSVDPARDSPERIGAWLGAFDEAFIGVTAPEAALAPLLEALSVSVHQERQGDETYNVVHNGTVYVLDSDVRWVAIFGGSTHSIDSIVGDLSTLGPRL
jgi:protein SCO1/2